MEGFVKLHRRIVEWEWYKEPNTRSVFMHLLLMANYESKKWKGQLVERGQRVTSLAHLAAETGLSVRQTRTALNNLEMTGELTRQTTNRNTVITICNYDTYQSRDGLSDTPNDTPLDKQTTSKRHARRQSNDNQTTTNKKDKKNKKKEVKKEELLDLFSAELERCRRSASDVVLLVDAYGRWIDHRAERGDPMNAEIVRRDAGRCCGLRMQRKKMNPPRPLPPASVLVALLEASMCEGTWKDWFYDDAFERLMRDDGENESPPPSRLARAGVDDPFGNGALSAPSEFPG